MTEEKITSLKCSISETFDRVHSDDIFDVDKVPIEVLDYYWQRYHPYTLTIDHRNPLASRTLAEGTDYKTQIETIREAILTTYPIPREHFIIKEDNHGLFAAILVALADDNVDTIEKAMEAKRFFRSQPTDDKLLTDSKSRKWIDLRFEPMDSDDVTDEIHRKYNRLYHLAPEKFSNNIRDNGLLVSNKNSSFRYSEECVFFMEGDITDDIQELVDTLYTQAVDKKVVGLTPWYTLFVFDLSRIDKTFRFFYDINEPNGIYTKLSIPSSAIIDEKKIKANTTDRIV